LSFAPPSTHRAGPRIVPPSRPMAPRQRIRPITAVRFVLCSRAFPGQEDSDFTESSIRVFGSRQGGERAGEDDPGSPCVLRVSRLAVAEVSAKKPSPCSSSQLRFGVRRYLYRLLAPFSRDAGRLPVLFVRFCFRTICCMCKKASSLVGYVGDLLVRVGNSLEPTKSWILHSCDGVFGGSRGILLPWGVCHFVRRFSVLAASVVLTKNWGFATSGSIIYCNFERDREVPSGIWMILAEGRGYLLSRHSTVFPLLKSLN
jgi:hypothetical protein